jgi:hypothetical protein
LSNGANGTTVEGTATLDYYFEVAGAANTYVPVGVIGTVSASGTTPGYFTYAIAYQSASYYDAATAAAAAKAGHPLELSAEACFEKSGCGPGEPSTVILDDTVLLLSDTPISVELYALAFDEYTGTSNVYFVATADPLIQIDPSYADAKDFSLAFSDDIVETQTASPVPEPSTWLLMLAGFGILGARHGWRSLRARSRRTVST